MARLGAAGSPAPAGSVLAFEPVDDDARLDEESRLLAA